MNRYLQKAEEIRKAINKFAENQADETLIDNKSAFQLWNGNGLEVKAGEIYLYPNNNELYRVVQDHTTQRDWTPDIAPALYTIIGGDWDEWEPGSYAKGTKRKHNCKKWVSNVDGNIWEPGATGVYTWDEWTE